MLHYTCTGFIPLLTQYFPDGRVELQSWISLQEVAREMIASPLCSSHIISTTKSLLSCWRSASVSAVDGQGGLVHLVDRGALFTCWSRGALCTCWSRGALFTWWTGGGALCTCWSRGALFTWWTGRGALCTWWTRRALCTWWTGEGACAPGGPGGAYSPGLPGNPAIKRYG